MSMILAIIFEGSIKFVDQVKNYKQHNFINMKIYGERGEIRER